MEHREHPGAHGGRAVRARHGLAAVRRGARWAVCEPTRLMILSAVVALVAVNLGPGLDLSRVWTSKTYLGIGGEGVRFDAAITVVDGLMTAFFLCVGLEIRREIAIGSLQSARAALAPIFCAVGGMLVPMVIYTSVAGAGAGASGWAVPSATDVALAVGVAGLVAPGLSPGARAFLLTLAVADDLGGIAVIGIWYSHGIAIAPTVAAVALAATYACLVRSRIIPLPIVLVLILPAWVLMWSAHIEPPIIGAIFGLATPIGRSDRGLSVCAEAELLLKRAAPLVGLVVLPLFAAITSSVTVTSGAIGSTVALGVALGLCLGKPIGIFGTFWILKRVRIAEHPAGSNIRELLGVSILGGVGFTVSLYIARVGLPKNGLEHSATFGVFAGSLLAATAGALYFRTVTRPADVLAANADYFPAEANAQHL
jgi:NhaA family Na+:H+ antiporter